MLKKLILSAALCCVSILFSSSLAFAAAVSNPTFMTAASQVKISNAKVELAQMGPYGQANPTAAVISTEVKMDISNQGRKTAKIIAATSDIAKQVQLHKMKNESGTMRMKKISKIKIRARTEKDLSYQGIHIMLIGLKKTLTKGELVPVTLIFSDGSHLQVNAKVQA